MTQAFNPFAQPAGTSAVNNPAPAAAPAAFPAAPAPVQPTAAAYPASRGGLDDPSDDGPGAPLLPHVDGRWRFRVVGYTTFVGHLSGPAVHISVQVVDTTQPLTTVGSTYRFMYKYDFANDRPAQGKVGTVHIKLLKQFWRAVTNDPNVSVKARHLQALTFDWQTTPVYVDCQGALVPWLNPKTNTTEPRRNETWLPAQ